LRTEDGESHLPKKDDQGKHHVHGQVKLASAKQIRKIMQKLLPVLQLLKKNRKINLIPLPRYVCLPCCLEEGHCSNRKERDYLTRLLAGLQEMQRELKEACHEWPLANYKVVNSCTLLNLSEDSSFSEWDLLMGKDPVHLTGDGYTKLANGIMNMGEGADVNFSGRKRGLEAEDDQPAPKIGGRKACIYTSGQG
jgi:hypothetical protein